MLQHKTSFRKIYSEAYSCFSALGYYDVIFCNEYGVVTEGTFNNIFLEKDGVMYTSPVDSGLLPGVFRQYLLESDQCNTAEKNINLNDILNADKIFLTNAIRGLTQVEFVMAKDGEKEECFA